MFLIKSRFIDSCSDLIPTRPPIPPVDIGDTILAISPADNPVSNV